MNKLREILSGLRESTPEAIDLVESITKPFFFREGHVILTPEEPWLKIYLITSGLAKGFLLHPSCEFLSFIKNTGLLVPLNRMQDRTEQDESICFLKDTKGYTLCIGKAKLLFRQCPEILMMLTSLLEDHQLEMLRIEQMQEEVTAEKRFLAYKKGHRDIIKHAPAADLCELMLLSEKELTELKRKHMPDSYA